MVSKKKEKVRYSKETVDKPLRNVLSHGCRKTVILSLEEDQRMNKRPIVYGQLNIRREKIYI